MMHFLGLVYVRTAAGFSKVSLQKLIKEEAKPTVRAKGSKVAMALVRSGLLVCERGQSGRKLRWNLKDFGPVSLPIAEAMIYETERQSKINASKYFQNKRKRQQLAEKGVETDANN